MRTCVFLVALLMMCSTAMASSVSTQGSWQHSPNSNYGDSGNGALRVETPVYKDLGIGAEYEYHGFASHDPYGSIGGQSLLGLVTYRPNVPWALKPYILGGLGWSWWQFDRSQDMIDRGIEISVGDSFAKKVGIGAEYELNKQWSLYMEWDYFQSHIPKDSYYADGSFANVAGDDNRSGRITIGQEEENLTFGIRYKF